MPEKIIMPLLEKRAAFSLSRFMHMPLRCFGLANICFVISIFALVLVQLDGFANDPGVGWHLKTGEWIIDHRSIPAVDPFLSYPLPRVWISDQWLSDLILYGLLRIGGWPFASAFLIVVFAATFFLLLYPALLRETKLFVLSALGAILAFKIAQIHFIFRPVVFSFPLYTLLYFALREMWTAVVNQKEVDSLLVLFRHRGIAFIILFVLWCNLHPSFVLGLLLVALFSLSLCSKFLYWPRNGKKAPIPLTVIIALPLLCAAASLCNPYGWRLHESILILGSSKYFMTLHEEWRSPLLREYSGQLFVFISVLVAGPFVYSSRVRRKFSIFEIFAWLSFFALAVDAVRILPYFGIASAPLLAESVSGLIRELPRKMTRRLIDLGRLERSAYPSRYAVLVLLSGILIAGVFGRIPFYSGDFGPAKDRFPYEAVVFLRDYVPQGFPAPIVATPDWGGFITYWGEGRIKPVIDDRNTLVGEAFYRKFFEELKGSVGDAKRFLVSVQARHLLLASDSKLFEKLRSDGEFRAVFKDDKSVVVEWSPPAGSNESLVAQGGA